MILLESIIIILGLAISLMSLKKAKKNIKYHPKRILAGLYISLCILSFILIVMKSEEAEGSGLRLFKTLNSIERIVTAQSDTLIALIDSISAMTNRMDTVVKKQKTLSFREKQHRKHSLSRISYWSRAMN